MRRVLLSIGIAASLIVAFAVLRWMPQALQSLAQRTATPSYLVAPGGPTIIPPVGSTPPPERDLAPQMDRADKATYIIRHPNGNYENLLVPPGWGFEDVQKVLGPGDAIQGVSAPPSFKHVPGTPPPIPSGVFPPLPPLTATWSPLSPTPAR